MWGTRFFSRARCLRHDYAVLFADVARSGWLIEIEQLAVEVAGGGIGVANFYDLRVAEGSAHDALRQAMHLHIAGAALQRDPDPRPKMQNVTNAYQARREVGAGEGILYTEDEHPARREHPA